MAIHYNQIQFQYPYPEVYKAFGSRIGLFSSPPHFEELLSLISASKCSSCSQIHKLFPLESCCTSCSHSRHMTGSPSHLPILTITVSEALSDH